MKYTMKYERTAKAVILPLDRQMRRNIHFSIISHKHTLQIRVHSFKGRMQVQGSCTIIQLSPAFSRRKMLIL